MLVIEEACSFPRVMPREVMVHFSHTKGIKHEIPVISAGQAGLLPASGEVDCTACVDSAELFLRNCRSMEGLLMCIMMKKTLYYGLHSMV